MLDAEKISVLAEWKKPARRKGVVISYDIKVICESRYSDKTQGHQNLQTVVYNDIEETYSQNILDLPDFSNCKFYVAARTTVGSGSEIHCEFQTPMTRMSSTYILMCTN